MKDTLQQALDEATAGTVIELAKGAYEQCGPFVVKEQKGSALQSLIERGLSHRGLYGIMNLQDFTLQSEFRRDRSRSSMRSTRYIHFYNHKQFQKIKQP
ncbi:hypothetical protein HZF08_02985 [Paenibacillus sp. CGMCC 1.16610]|uniref:Uncharacterized protein n=1 Tax=Paenibacillus anseongense TaxID=2682845 RepID=A0ABW9UEN6_9BACL|nr:MULTISPECIES: hypothetical protein [Paenibacillus]MBA2937256.1 hypothetical protein [Paenibacillus sp. CGMCC 1.16610]MVQ36315.1 hypothetical protein [Paenibacillus anseongense]